MPKGNDVFTSGFVLKTKYNTDKSDLEKNISDADKKVFGISGLIQKQIMMLKLVKYKANNPVLRI